jgi:uncharacterized alpha-E superfamily protein
MLGRTAAELYWMSRYVERAENMARLLEVGYRISLMPGAIEGHRDEWKSTLSSTACLQGYLDKHRDIDGARVVDFLLFDEDNASSIKSNLKAARNNGRSVRTALTRDVWESLNSTWNDFAQINPAEITSDRLPGFLEWVKQKAMAFRGAVLGTMLRNDPYYFTQLGNFIERADNTARILDVKYYILLPRSSDVGSELDSQQWAQILRSVSAHGSYRWFYKDSRFKPWLVSEFLILKDEMPRSLMFSYNWINMALQSLEELYGQRYDCQGMAADIQQHLKKGNMKSIFQEGLHEFLQGFMQRNNALSASIAKHYNFP